MNSEVISHHRGTEDTEVAQRNPNLRYHLFLAPLAFVELSVLRLVPWPAIVPRSSTVIREALITVSVALFERITEDLLVLSPVSEVTVIAFGCVSPVTGTLWVVALTSLRISSAHVHSVTVAAFAGDLQT
jgi:hypothetical protein